MQKLHAPSVVRQSLCSRSFWTAARCYRCTACFAFMGVILLILLSIFVVAPAIDGLSLKPATCTVISSEMSGTQSCSCGKGCSSSFPCLKIYVEYIPEEHEKRNASNVLLHETVFEDNVVNQCSIAPCESYKNANKERVQAFQDSHGHKGQQYVCYYNDKKPEEVVTRISDFKMAIVHSILWPTLLIVAMACIMLGVYVYKKRSTHESLSYVE